MIKKILFVFFLVNFCCFLWLSSYTMLESVKVSNLQSQWDHLSKEKSAYNKDNLELLKELNTSKEVVQELKQWLIPSGIIPATGVIYLLHKKNHKD